MRNGLRSDGFALCPKKAFARAMIVFALLAGGCADLGFLRGGPDSDAVPRATINGNPVNKEKVTLPVPVERVSAGINQAAERETAQIIAAFGGVYSNRRIEDQLARIVSRLVAKSSVPSQPFQITILNSPAVNAFALPGGYLFITRGLLALASDSSEIAAVMAHEMAHVTGNHGRDRLVEARTKEIVANAVDAVVSDPATRQEIKQEAALSFVAFTQLQELSADEIGINNAGLAGYDPFAAARFLEVMERYQNYQNTASIAKKADDPDFLSSHPSTPQRIERARIAARKFGAPGIGTQDRDAYLKALDSMIFGDVPTEGFVRDRSFFHPQLRFTFSVPAGYVIENRPEAVIAKAANEDSVHFDGVQVPGNLSLADYIQTGWLRGLDPQTIMTFTVNGAPAASATAEYNGWTFKLILIRAQTSTYRMLFATLDPNTQFDRAVSSTVASFRSLTQQDVLGLAPLRLSIVRTQPGDTSLTLSRGMQGLVANPDQAFNALNGLGLNEQPQPGTLVKIVTDSPSG